MKLESLGGSGLSWALGKGWRLALRPVRDIFFYVLRVCAGSGPVNELELLFVLACEE
jgi:hypothetical protein